MEVIQRRTEYRLRKAKEREHIVEGLVKALDMIDAIIALIRGVGRRRDGPRRASWRRRSSSPRSRRTTSSTCSCAGSPSSRARSCATSSTELQATITELESILASDDEAARGHQGRARRGARASTPTSGARRAHGRHRRPRRRSTSSTTKRSSSCSRHKGYVKTVAADAFRQQGRGGRGRARRQPAGRGLRRAPAHHHRALVPVVLLEPRPGRTGCARTRSR